MDNSKANQDLVSNSRMEGDASISDICGEIDLHNSPDLRSAIFDVLAKAQVKRLILNLSQVPYMDSSAIAVLVEVLQRLRPSGGRVMLVELQPRVKGLLQIARLDSIFVLADNVQQALALK